MIQFAVTLKDGEWTVFQDGVAKEQGYSRSAAIRRAEQLAFDAVARGESVELLIQDYTGEMRRSLSGGE